MRIKSIFLSVICCASLLSGCGRAATGPQLNTLADGTWIGDERDFVRVADATDGSTTMEDFQTGEYVLQPGHEYVFMVTYHNSAEPRSDGVNSVESAVLTVVFPEIITADGNGEFGAIFTYGDSEAPTFCGDQVALSAEADIRLELLPAGPTDTEPPCIVMCSKADGSAYTPLSPLFVRMGDVVMHDIEISEIAPGYDNAGYFFYKFKAVEITE